MTDPTIITFRFLHLPEIVRAALESDAPAAVTIVLGPRQVLTTAPADVVSAVLRTCEPGEVISCA